MCDISLNFYPTKKLGMTFANFKKTQGYKVKRNHTLGFQEELENEKYKKKVSWHLPYVHALFIYEGLK